jgi:hypothetical protein
MLKQKGIYTNIWEFDRTKISPVKFAMFITVMILLAEDTNLHTETHLVFEFDNGFPNHIIERTAERLGYQK